MSEAMADPARIADFHAHIYYEPDTRSHAAALRQEIAQRFPARLGRWHDEPVGPHSRSMYQVLFAPAEFGRIVPWLMLNRGPLVILVHPSTGDDLADHTAHASWLGEPLPLRLEELAKSD